MRRGHAGVGTAPNEMNTGSRLVHVLGLRSALLTCSSE